jgi:hypothetical protein
VSDKKKATEPSNTWQEVAAAAKASELNSIAAMQKQFAELIKQATPLHDLKQFTAAQEDFRKLLDQAKAMTEINSAGAAHRYFLEVSKRPSSASVVTREVSDDWLRNTRDQLRQYQERVAAETAERARLTELVEKLLKKLDEPRASRGRPTHDRALLREIAARVCREDMSKNKNCERVADEYHKRTGFSIDSTDKGLRQVVKAWAESLVITKPRPPRR